jgi:eukaryotic-like serine/threonine-protein kinase
MTCTTCSARLPDGTAFCGTCGAHTSKRRDSLTGLLFDGRYRIEAKLAAGGFGSIYRATHVPTGSRVALKVLHPDLASDPTLNARFRREAAVLAALRDPHTIETYEHGQAADGTLYIAMELLTGRSLQAELRTQGPLPWWRMLAIMRGVCRSLIEAHALGIVHRDLKPANIHLEHRNGKPDFVKVLDFGIVKVIGNASLAGLGGPGGEEEDDDESAITRVGQAIGTLEYMSPEQIVGGEIDRRTDLYTLGVVAYEMITGRRPFADASGPTSLMTALMTREPVAPSTMFHQGCLPEAVDRLILRCLASDPEQRFADASELAEAIDAALLAAATPVVLSRTTTLPGSGPSPRAPSSAPAPRPAPTLRPAPSISSPSMAAMAALDDGDVTNVDVVPLFDPEWEPDLGRSAPRLARTPHLDEPPAPPSFKAARGSTVTVTPMKLVAVAAAQAARSAQPAPPRLPVLRLAAWAMGLLASGIGLGVIVASLA